MPQILVSSGLAFSLKISEFLMLTALLPLTFCHSKAWFADSACSELAVSDFKDYIAGDNQWAQVTYPERDASTRDVLQWLELVPSTFIRDIALACWTVPASQGSCERAWANLSRQSSAIRSRLLPEKKAKITMLEANWHLLLGDTSQETRARERCLKRSLPSLAAGLSRDMAKRARNLVAQQRQQDFEPAPGSDDESDCHPLSSSESSSSSSP